MKTILGKISREILINYKNNTKKLDDYIFIEPQVKPTEIILLMDTTYFGDFGIMFFKDYKSKKILKYTIVENVNNTDYKKGVEELQKQGWIIKAIVYDGRKLLYVTNGYSKYY